MSSGRTLRWRITADVSISRRIASTSRTRFVEAVFLGAGLSQLSRQRLYDGFSFSIRPGQIVAVIGPSGAGKTVLLRQVNRSCGRVVSLDVESVARSTVPVIDLLEPAGLDEAMQLLSRVGLSEAGVMVSAGRELSGGQQYRLALARAFARAARGRAPRLIVADEFCSTLDAVTAQILCRQVRKMVRRDARIAMLVATPRVELLEALQPDEVIIKPLGEPPTRSRSAGRTKTGPPRRIDPLDWPIRRGTIGDYKALGRFHYLTGPPAAHKRVYVIRTPRSVRALGCPAVAAVLVVSPPLANVRGRNIATCGRYCGADRAAALELLNREVECISRVIVHPTFRGCGLAVRLVRHAIARARTPLVEALAVMGHVNPFFARAGMRAYQVGPDRACVRLLSAAEAVGLSPQQVAAVEPVRRLLRTDSAAARFLRAELKRAVQSAGLDRKRPHRGRSGEALAQLCRRTSRRYVYYLACNDKEHQACPKSLLPKPAPE